VKVFGKEYVSYQVPDLINPKKYERYTIIGLKWFFNNFDFIINLSGKNFKIKYIKDIIINKNMSMKFKSFNFDPRKPHIEALKSDRKKKEYKINLFIDSIYMMGFKLNEKFWKEELNPIFNKATSKMNDLAKDISMYIGEFDISSGQNFLNYYKGLKDINVASNLTKACIKFKEFAHTEYMLYYYIEKESINNQDILKNGKICFVSFHDMCEKCERLWAKKANDKTIVKVASFKKYYESRNKIRINGNKNLILLFNNLNLNNN